MQYPRLRRKPASHDRRGSDGCPVSPRAADRFFGARLADQYADHYNLIVSIFKGIVLGVAAVTLLAILASNESTVVKANGIGLWLGSFGNVVCTYNASMVVSLVVTTPPNLIDLVDPFVIGILELAHFAILVPLASDLLGHPPSSDQQLAHMQWWFVILLAILVGALVTEANVQLQLTATTRRAAAEVVPMLNWCKGAVRKVQVSATVSILVVLVLVLLMRFGFPAVSILKDLAAPEQIRRWQGVFGAILFLGMVPAVLLQERGRQAVVAVATANPRSESELGGARDFDGPAGRAVIRDRVGSQYARHYHLIVSVFKGLPLTSAAATLLAIFSSSTAASVKVTALALWFASLAVVMATYDGIMVASIMVDSPPNGLDVIVPFVLGIAEFALFALISPIAAHTMTAPPGSAAQLQHLTWWPMALALVALTATVGIINSKHQIRASVNRSPKDVQPLLHWYIANLRQDQLLTAGLGFAMAMTFALMHYGPASLRSWQDIVAALVIFAMINGIVSQERMRRMVGQSVNAESFGDVRRTKMVDVASR